MNEKAIILLVIILITILVIYLFHDTPVMKNMSDLNQNLKNKIFQVRKNDIEIANGPVIYHRTKPEKQYQSVIMRGQKFGIGRSFCNHLIAKSKTVEDRHALIRKRIKGDKVYYELINLGKVNPVRYLNHEEGEYQFLGYKDKVELSARDTFMIGDMTLQIIIPNTDKPTETERAGDLHLEEEAKMEDVKTKTYKQSEDAFDIPEFDV